jgi:hypothetical protein
MPKSFLMRKITQATWILAEKKIEQSKNFSQTRAKTPFLTASLLEVLVLDMPLARLTAKRRPRIDLRKYPMIAYTID